MTETKPGRAHLIAGGFPPGSYAGHDHDYARLRLLGLLAERDIPASVANDFADVEKWLPVSQLLITYVAGPYPDAAQTRAIARWLEAGGHWLALHGTSGGRAERVEGARQRRTVKTEHHALLGSYFLTHPPICEFRVEVSAADSPLTRGLGTSFVVEDEPYFVELLDPGSTQNPADCGLRPERHLARHRHALRLGHLAATRRQDPRARVYPCGRQWRRHLLRARALPQPRDPCRPGPRPDGQDGADLSRRVGNRRVHHTAAQRHRLGRARLIAGDKQSGE